jgi:hypothetical protein
MSTLDPDVKKVYRELLLEKVYSILVDMLNVAIMAMVVSQVLGAPYQLAYAIPLLVLSLPITFAAAFLTLDRTRTFVPTSTAISTPSRSPWQFHGGVGGMLGGWALGGEGKAVIITLHRHV